jgi:hypothetical protein
METSEIKFVGVVVVTFLVLNRYFPTIYYELVFALIKLFATFSYLIYWIIQIITQESKT